MGVLLFEEKEVEALQLKKKGIFLRKQNKTFDRSQDT
jgi:hypothetical protein